MFTKGKITSIRIVRWILDVILYTGGTIIGLLILLTFGNQFMGIGVYASTSQWPVKMIFGGSNGLSLTLIDAHKNLETQYLIEMVPTRAFLQLICPLNFMLIGFDVVWLLLTYGTVILIAYILRKIVLHMESNDFFDQQTPDRLRLISWTIMGTSVLKSVLTYLYGLYTASMINAIPTVLKASVVNSNGKPVALSTGPFIDIPYEQLFIGAVILALAIAFQNGLDLKQEQSLTV